jgi:hypothetical protein
MHGEKIKIRIDGFEKIDTFRDISLGHTKNYRINIRNVRRCSNVFHESVGETEGNHPIFKIRVDSPVLIK